MSDIGQLLTTEPAIGMHTRYRAIAGDVYDAVIEHLEDGLADISVSVPGCEEPVRLTCIPTSDHDRR